MRRGDNEKAEYPEPCRLLRPPRAFTAVKKAALRAVRANAVHGCAAASDEAACGTVDGGAVCLCADNKKAAEPTLDCLYRAWRDSNPRSLGS